MDALASRWHGESRTSERTAAEAAGLLEHLAAVRWAEVEPHQVEVWCWASRTNGGSGVRAKQSTACNRQQIARVVFEEAARLGAPVDPDAVVGVRIARPAAKPVRPLTDDEAGRVRKWADRALVRSRRRLVVALAFAGGTATEIAKARFEDIDLDAATVRFTGAAARVARLDGWAVEAVRRCVCDHPADDDGAPVCVSVRTTPEREVESVSWHLRRALRDAGLYELEGVSANSIRLTAARRILRVDGVAAAAAFLGWVSLDRTADALGHHWRHPDG